MKLLRVLCAVAAAMLLLLPSGVWSTIVKYMSFDEQISVSDYVVRGTVTSKSNKTIKKGDKEIFVSIYELDVTRTFMGADRPEKLKLMNPGGGWKTPELYLPVPEGFIDYPIGSDLVFVLEPNLEDTHVPIALQQSIYRIEETADEGLRYVRLEGSATMVNENGQPFKPLFEQTEFTSSEFEEAVKASAAKAGKKYQAPEHDSTGEVK